jgi:hypothetical protein
VHWKGNLVNDVVGLIALVLSDRREQLMCAAITGFAILFRSPQTLCGSDLLGLSCGVLPHVLHLKIDD